MPQYQKLIEKKNQWLLNQVSVKYPTPESIAGSKLYLEREKKIEYIEYVPVSGETGERLCPEEIYRADFHRITVMFAKLQSMRWADDEEACRVLEFLAQITLDEGHDIYIGFENSEPVCSALVTAEEKTVLISDFFASSEHADIREGFVRSLIESDDRFSSTDTFILGEDK